MRFDPGMKEATNDNFDPWQTLSAATKRVLESDQLQKKQTGERRWRRQPPARSQRTPNTDRQHHGHVVQAAKGMGVAGQP